MEAALRCHPNFVSLGLPCLIPTIPPPPCPWGYRPAPRMGQTSLLSLPEATGIKIKKVLNSNNEWKCENVDKMQTHLKIIIFPNMGFCFSDQFSSPEDILNPSGLLAQPPACLQLPHMFMASGAAHRLSCVPYKCPPTSAMCSAFLVGNCLDTLPPALQLLPLSPV